MATGKSDYRLGRIVSAFLIGRNGKREEHPAVIISPDKEIVQPEDFDPRAGGGHVGANLIAVLGISSKYKSFGDPFVTLPIGATTQLTKDCAVILNWYTILDIPDHCEHLLGDIPPRLMVEINSAYRADLTRQLGSVQGTVVHSLGLLHSRR